MPQLQERREERSTHVFFPAFVSVSGSGDISLSLDQNDGGGGDICQSANVIV